jgi:hypothetical protein
MMFLHEARRIHDPECSENGKFSHWRGYLSLGPADATQMPSLQPRSNAWSMAVLSQFPHLHMQL